MDSRLNRVGIIGGGQLALMMGQALTRLGMRPVILTEHSSDPAARVIPESVFGLASDPVALSCLFSQVETVLFENEFVDCRKLGEVAESWKVRFVPGLEAISTFQNKLAQKELLQRLQIPTADFRVISSEDHEPRVLHSHFGGGYVLKWARMGYDGKGVLVVRGGSEGQGSVVEEFFKVAKRLGSEVYAEKEVRFKRELALIAAYSVRGEFVAYPLMVSEQRRGICSLVYGPARALGVSVEQERLAQGYARKLAESALLHGVFAIEFFETQSGDLIVNEIAPRVHNSGHYTQNAGITDQFENHARAALGLPLGTVGVEQGFVAMLNILGPEGVIAKETQLPIPGPRSHLHWYGKSEVRPRRKLGHLNGRVESVVEGDSLLAELKNCNETWIKQVTS